MLWSDSAEWLVSYPVHAAGIRMAEHDGAGNLHVAVLSGEGADIRSRGNRGRAGHTAPRALGRLAAGRRRVGA